MRAHRAGLMSAAIAVLAACANRAGVPDHAPLPGVAVAYAARDGRHDLDWEGMRFRVHLLPLRHRVSARAAEVVVRGIFAVFWEADPRDMAALALQLPAHCDWWLVVDGQPLDWTFDGYDGIGRLLRFPAGVRVDSRADAERVASWLQSR